MEHNEAWQRQFHKMNDSDLAIHYHWIFTIVDGLLAENRMLELGGSFAKNNNEVNFFIDDYSTNDAKIKHYRVFLDYINKIMDERATAYNDYNPISGYQISDNEKNFYEEQTLVSLFCNLQVYSAVVTEIQKIEKLAIEIQNSVPVPKNKTHLVMVTHFHTAFVTKMKLIIKTIIKKMAK